MHIDSNGWVSVAELIFFIPALLISFFICYRHGFNRSSGWLYTLLLCGFRTAGAICQLMTYTDKSTGLLKAVVIIDSIGLSPLLLATLGMLSRFVDWINIRGRGIFTIKHFRLLQLLITLGLILSIAGGSGGSAQSDGTVSVSTTSKVAVILYLISFCGLCLIWILSMSNIASVPDGEKRIALGVIVALPFILIRLAYSFLVVFVHNHTFSVVGGSAAVHVAMSTIEEFIVVVIYLILGFTLQSLSSDQQGPIASRPWKERQSNGRGSSKRGSRSRDRAHKINTSNQGYIQDPVYTGTSVHPSDASAYVPANGFETSRGYGQV